MKSSSTPDDMEKRGREVVQTIRAVVMSQPGHTMEWYAGRLNLDDTVALSAIIDRLIEGGVLDKGLIT